MEVSLGSTWSPVFPNCGQRKCLAEVKYEFRAFLFQGLYGAVATFSSCRCLDILTAAGEGGTSPAAITDESVCRGLELWGNGWLLATRYQPSPPL